ncbi:RNA polymerase sigma-70 factor (ECF subfamily) [Pseudonocardia sediminis]|uniref:RNA polymerase sigma-70 factor (ECF subfamily) n=1 Tax=Pseudonocardia sediminis TaxID=1397368 RepID=A0A4Q7U7K5_PSEST|nr:sigma-70 family RNA polymerase sigma factor [Pseudonocardia sediminis]RZT75458.1 RNA polymerase sigma-70 factor (ECF subfamily) [Pseudonocardia sediminis]
MTTADEEPGDHSRRSSAGLWPGSDHDASPPPPATRADVIEEFTAFYRASAPKLIAFLRWQGASLPDAADCAQDALTQAFRQWSTLTYPYAWCRLVASRLYARRVAALHEDPVDDLPHEPGSPLLNPETRYTELETRHRVLALLDRLPSRQRQVMAWAYDGATPAETATALQISSDAVRANLYKARTTLRALLEATP